MAVLDTIGQVFTGLSQGAQAASGVAGLLNSYASSQASRAQGIYQAGLYEVQALDTLRLAAIRADQDQRYAAVQAGRKLLQSEFEALNYKIAGNQLLRNMRRTNAAVRARAAASGVSAFSGSAASVQDANIRNTYFDVGMTDLNMLAARVLGFEDALNMYGAGKQQADLTMNAAETQARQYRTAARFAEASGGLMGNVQLGQGIQNFLSTAADPVQIFRSMGGAGGNP